jgi:hypothetical protein
VRIAEQLDVLWRDYVASTPQAQRIHQLLTERGEMLCNDHLALRTYGVAGLGIAALARPLEALGWRERESYRACDRHLSARYWQHDDAALPRVVISEIDVEELSPDAQAVIGALVRDVPAEHDERGVPPWTGRPRRITQAEYRALHAESEYAAWVAAFGPSVHHFTVDVDSLSTFPDLEALAAFLVEHGFRLDDADRAIRGSRATRLQRLSTRPDAVTVELADARLRIPSGRYEFSRRYRLPSGERSHGFAPSSDRHEAADVGVLM